MSSQDLKENPIIASCLAGIYDKWPQASLLSSLAYCPHNKHSFTLSNARVETAKHGLQYEGSSLMKTD